MIWSYSSARTFTGCQRQWYFKNIVADARAADGLAREAYLLSKLQSIHAWRGYIVDKIISDQIIGALNRNSPISLRDILNHAHSVFNQQLAFGRENRIRRHDVALYSPQFAAFRDVDYGGSVSDEAATEAWKEVETALRKLFKMDELRALIKKAAFRIPQHKFQFKIDETFVLSFADLVLLFDAEAPVIIDWKVHHFANTDNRQQLALYALGLTRHHAASKSKMSGLVTKWKPTEIRLLEAQLLTGEPREYTLDEDDIADIEAYIAATSSEMQLLTEPEDGETLDIEDFAVTQYPKRCETCQFTKICWRTPDVGA